MDILRLFSLMEQKSKATFYQIALEKRAEFIFDSQRCGEYEVKLSSDIILNLCGGDEIEVINSGGMTRWHVEKNLITIGWWSTDGSLTTELNPQQEFQGDNTHFIGNISNISNLGTTHIKEAHMSVMSVIRWLLEIGVPIDFQSSGDPDDDDCYQLKLPGERDSNQRWEEAKKKFKKL